MAKMPELLVDLNKGALEAMLHFARVSMDGGERMMRLQFAAAKTFAAEQAETVQALAGVNDPEALMTLRARLVEKSVDSALGYSRHVYEVATHTQHELSELTEQRFTMFQGDMAAAMEKMIKAAPGGSEAAVETVKSTMVAVQFAMDSMTKAAKHASELAEANVKAVTEAVSRAVKSVQV